MKEIFLALFITFNLELIKNAKVNKNILNQNYILYYEINEFIFEIRWKMPLNKFKYY